MVQEIEKSLTDYKTYRIISLDNDLKVVLISDVKPDVCPNLSEDENDDENDDEIDNENDNGVQKSAAALCINVGSFNDPVELQGLAHYLEHMVFMGSKKYPTENDFDACVSQHGGSSNAWTDNERTLFYFDSHFKHFESILDKFANFFISPLLLQDTMDRELTAVNSEFEMVYSNDTQRTEYLLQMMSKSDSPYRLFQCGNTKSLKDDPTGKNIDIYKYLQDFRLRMYSSHWMTLAIQSRDSLDNLEKVVRSIFSDIPNNKATMIDSSRFAKPFDTMDFSRFYYVVPVKDIKSLKLTWSLPSLMPHYKSKPMHILGHLLGHEGHGSLTEYLRKMNYIVQLEAGNSNSGFDSASFNSLFALSVNLTDHGFERITEIVQAIFAFIEILRSGGVPERLFREYQQIQRNEFLFKEIEEPVEVVESLAVNLQLFEPQHILSGHDIVYEYRPELYSEMLALLTVDNVNIMLLSPSHAPITDNVTEYFDVKYAVRDFTAEERAAWCNPGTIAELHLPDDNKFLASQFDLLPVTDVGEVPINLATVTYPQLEHHGELWHLLDTKFRIPKAIISFYMWSPTVITSPHNVCLTDLILYAVNQQLSAVAYDASVAGLDYRVIFQESGLLIKIDGFNDKISLLFSTIIDFLRDFSIDESKLVVYKESIRQIYRNLAIKTEKLAGFIQKKILYQNEWLVTERLEALKNISLHDVIDFHAQLFGTMRVKSYFHGNISAETAKDCFTYCVENLKLCPSETITRTLLRSFPVGDNRIRVLNLNPNDVNTAIMIDYQIGPGTVQQQAMNQFLTHVLSEPCFDYLRTKETLGYSVGLYDTKNRGILGMCVYVMSQSNKFSIDHCNEKMHTFFDNMAMSIIENLSEDDFNDFKASFISNKLIEDIQMSNAESRNWREIFQQEFVFGRRYRHVEYIEAVTKTDLMSFFLDNYLDMTKQKKIIVEVDVKEDKTNLLQSEDLYDMPLTYLNATESADKPNDLDSIISKMSVYAPHLINC